MRTFSKPFIQRSYRKASKPRRYPYPERMFREHDVFSIFILDGGAFLFANQTFGGGTGKDILRALAAGSLFAPWKVAGRVNWNQAFDDSLRPPYAYQVEKQGWLNRLFFLLPMAQEYLRTADEKWARAWYSHFREWQRAQPYVAARDQRTPPWTGDRCWFDMQITWRLLVLVHSVFLLQRSAFLTERHWRSVYAAIQLHADLLLGEARAQLARKTRGGNHSLQKGNALVHVGLLFPELDAAADYLEVGRETVRQHLREEIYADGGNVEASPSYGHFIARLYLEVFLLLKNNRMPAIPGLEASLRKQYRFLAATASPAGTTLPLSDSYELSVKEDLQVVEQLFPLPRMRPKSLSIFPQSCFAVVRGRSMTAYLDGMALGEWHHHDGKPNLLLYVGEQPLLVDSGCFEYDKHPLREWIRSDAAHNVVLVDGGRPRPPRMHGARMPVVSVQRCEHARSYDRVVMVHRWEGEGLAYTWTRAVKSQATTVEVMDRVRASREVSAEQLFYLAPLDLRLLNGGREAAVPVGEQVVRVKQQAGHAGGAFSIGFFPAMGQLNRVAESPRLSSTGVGRDLVFHVTFSLT
jgi:hypothetical protein